VKEQALEVTQKALAVQIPVSLVRVVVQAVDGFGNVRQDWPVVIENVASGMGQVSAEVVEGQKYKARATGFGVTKITEFEARGPQMVVTIKIPTARLSVRVVDERGVPIDSYVTSVQISGPMSQSFSTPPRDLEVLAGQYIIRVRALGGEGTAQVTLNAGEMKAVEVVVPGVGARGGRIVIRGPSGTFTAVVSGNTLVLDGLSVGIPRVSDWVGNGSYAAFGIWYSPGCTEGRYPDRPEFYIKCAQGAEINVVAVKDPKARVTCRDIYSSRVIQPSEARDRVEIYRLTQSLGVECRAGFDAPSAPQIVGVSTPTSQPTSGLPLELVAAVAVVAVAAAFAVLKLRRRAPPSPTRMWTSGGVSSGFCLEHHGGIIPLSTYTVVGKKDFPGLPEEALAKIDERHFAVYYRDGEWWVEDLGSRYGTYLNGVRVRKARLKEGDVISAGVVVTLVFKQCGAVKRVIVEGN